jgi:hypothetical protein
MGSTESGRFLKSTLSREWARARIEEDEANKYRAARGVFGNHTTGKETPIREIMGRSNTRGMDETND